MIVIHNLSTNNLDIGQVLKLPGTLEENTINTYTSILHPSIIELIVEKVYTNVGQFTEQHTKREQIAYEKALAEQELSQESTEK